MKVPLQILTEEFFAKFLENAITAIAFGVISAVIFGRIFGEIVKQHRRNFCKNPRRKIFINIKQSFAE